MENRKHPRFPVQFRSSFSSTNAVSGVGTLGDLSIRGCRIYSHIDVKPGTALQLRIEVTDDEPPLQINQAIVRWYRDSSFGLEFVSLTADEWARLQHVVKELEMEPYQRDSRDEKAV
ncbi:MAG: PilZ domain-containing protein [Nitrospira sp.]|nr:MAG: PilZ domain-containing protein [Nitrospira sp.]